MFIKGQTAMRPAVNPATVVDQCDTLMFDMDGTLLDLAFDNYMWMQHIPEAYARARGITGTAARGELYEHYRRLEGQLDWYCLDHWSDRLGLDVLGLHRAEQRRIGWLPGAQRCLEALSARGRRLLLVTNSHPDTLRVKDDATGIAAFFDRVYTSHEFGHAKESRGFWRALDAAESFDARRTMFVDDTESVLLSAERHGIDKLLVVTRPDTTRPARAGGRFAGIESIAELGPAAGGARPAQECFLRRPE